jgi:integrase/recombinase XerD
MSDTALPTKIRPKNRLLTSAEFQHLSAVPPEVEWFANIRNKSTRRAYETAIADFMGFTGIARPEEFRVVTRAHVIAWREDLVRRELGGSTVRHRLAALSSLFEYLCEKNAVTHNPVKGVKRPRSESGEGKTPALGDHQARELLASPAGERLKDKRDRAILSTLLYHALRRDELCKLKVRDFHHTRRGVPHLKVSGKGEKTRYLPLHPGTNTLIHEYLEAAGHEADENGPLFRPVKNNRTGTLEGALTPDGLQAGISGDRRCELSRYSRAPATPGPSRYPPGYRAHWWQPSPEGHGHRSQIPIELNSSGPVYRRRPDVQGELLITNELYEDLGKEDGRSSRDSTPRR